MLHLAPIVRVCARAHRTRLLHATRAAWRAPVVTLEEMKQLVDNPVDGTHLIDVRGRDEVASSGALGDSVSIVPLPELPAALDMDDEDFEAEYRFPKPKASDTVVFSCRSGVRSESACEIATAAGYLDVKNFRGSALEWYGTE